MTRSESWGPSWDEAHPASAAQPGPASHRDKGGYGGDYHDDGRYGPAADSALAAGGFVRALRALSGSVAAGLVLLTLVAIVAGIIGAQRGFPGPGAVSISVHVVGASAALVCQRFADRRRNFVAVLASLAVFALAAVVLWTQWWN